MFRSRRPWGQRDRPDNSESLHGAASSGSSASLPAVRAAGHLDPRAGLSEREVRRLRCSAACAGRASTMSSVRTHMPPDSRPTAHPVARSQHFESRATSATAVPGSTASKASDRSSGVLASLAVVDLRPSASLHRPDHLSSAPASAFGTNEITILANSALSSSLSR